MTTVQGYSSFVLRDKARYSVGQTLDEAKQSKCDIQFFRKLDLDGNGILSQEEVLKGKLAEDKNNSGGFGISLGLQGAALGGVGYAIKKFGKSTKASVIGILAMVGGAIFAGIGAYSLCTGKNSNVSRAQEELERFYADKEAMAKDEQYKGNISEILKEDPKEKVEKQEEAKESEIPPDTSAKKQDDETRTD